MNVSGIKPINVNFGNITKRAACYAIHQAEGSLEELKKIGQAVKEQKGNFYNIYLGSDKDGSTPYYYVSDGTNCSCSYSTLDEACIAANEFKQQGKETAKFNSLARKILNNCDDIDEPKFKKD